MMARRIWKAMLPAAVVVAMAGCHPSVRVEPIRVEPIHVTMDINIRVDRELDQFFDFQDEVIGEAEEPAATSEDVSEAAEDAYDATGEVAEP